MTLGNDNGTDGQTDGQTDRQTDRQSATQYAAPPREEGRIKTLTRCSTTAVVTLLWANKNVFRSSRNCCRS